MRFCGERISVNFCWAALFVTPGCCISKQTSVLHEPRQTLPIPVKITQSSAVHTLSQVMHTPPPRDTCAIIRETRFIPCETQVIPCDTYQNPVMQTSSPNFLTSAP